MTTEDPEIKAILMFRKDGLDLKLTKLWDAVKHYPYQKDSDPDFEAETNIGLTSISLESTTSPETLVNLDLICGVLGGQYFKIGEQWQSLEFPDGEISRTATIFLYLDSTLGIAANYEDSSCYARRPEDLKISSLAEFHYSTTLVQFLNIAESLILAQQQKKTEIDRKKEIERKKGKFSF